MCDSAVTAHLDEEPTPGPSVEFRSDVAPADRRQGLGDERRGPEVRDGGLQIEYGLGCKARQERSAAVLERWLADREL